MLVRDHMSEKTITVQRDTSVSHARSLLRKHRIRQLPVLKGERLVGIITDRDLRGADTTQQSVGELMTAKPAVIRPDAPIDEAARVLRTHKIGALPVVEGKALIGILSGSDVLDAFVEFCGVLEPTYHLVVSGADGANAKWQVRRVIEQQRADLKWIYRDKRSGQVHLRLKTPRVDDVVTALEAAGFEVSTVVAPARRQRA